MLPGTRAQFWLALLAISCPALCAAADVPASQSTGQPPFIGLLLPLNAPDFARAADAVRLGCQAAMVLAEKRQPLQILRTDARPESILAEYEAAVQRGATAMVGPLTRSGVAALAATGKISVPTLALNVVEGDAPMPARLYTLALSVEPEARQVARIVFARGMREAAVVQFSSAFAKRVARAFSDEWFSLGGNLTDVREFGPQSDLFVLRQRLADSEAQFTFLAVEAEQARVVRPYLNNQIPVYATSQINDGKSDAAANVDLNGIRFVDMPWLVQLDHPAVMVYPRPEGMAADLQRLYALGIDSCRIAAELAAGSQRISLDGVSGKITLRSGNAIQREPVQAVFLEGAGVALEERK